MPGGMGDTFSFDGYFPPPPGQLCAMPAVGHPITQGNIVVKATGIVP